MKKYSRVYVEITNICNRNCSFCPGTKREARRMTCDEFSLVLDRISGVTEYIYLHLMGEPLTHPNLCELISMARDRGFKCAVTTNGTLLPTRGEALLSSGIYKINISLHSFENGSADDYASYIRGCIDFADAASKRGVLSVLRLWNRGFDEGRNIDTLSLIREKFSECEWVEGVRGARIRDKLHLEYGDRFDWPNISADDMGSQVFCHGLGDHFGILVDGSLVPCCLDSEGAVMLGNVFDTPVEDILSSPRATAISRGFKNKRAVEELCRKCGYARRFKM